MNIINSHIKCEVFPLYCPFFCTKSLSCKCFSINNNNCSVFYLFSLLTYIIKILNKRYFFNKFKSE